jgi:nucleotide-binding universal stress UspA family protein
MKLIVGCDEHDLSEFLDALEHCAPLQGADILFAHVVDPAAGEHWGQMAGHHWFRRHPGPREYARFEQAAVASAQEILHEAMERSATWPAIRRRPLELHGNPERELVRLALVEQADMVAVGQHQLTLGPRALGRCARFVVDHAPCCVLLVRNATVRQAGEALLGERLSRKP